jgi:hypothetical protein
MFMYLFISLHSVDPNKIKETLGYSVLQYYFYVHAD